ncbi:MAG: TetR/AcrR family transcriptional regulator [Pseudomonadota bacterium]
MPRRSDKRDRLLDAAAQIFWKDGYAGTSLADIANGSGVPLGNIYYYFKTKAEIAEGVADIFMAETLASLDEIDRTNDDPIDALRAFVSLLRDSAAIRAELGCPLARGVRDFSDPAPQASQKVNDVFETLIGWLSQTLSRAGHRQAVRQARSAIARWQGAIVLAHSAGQETVLLEALTDLEADLLALIRKT